MTIRSYSKRLGEISDDQFKAALERFDLGTFVRAEPISTGLFGQNVFVTSTKGEYVLRGTPHFAWQFPSEQFFAQQLHERTQTPVPWPYYIDANEDIFGWSYALMPRMPGRQLDGQETEKELTQEDKRGIARALGRNLAEMQRLTWTFAGRYDVTSATVQPFELANEVAWPFPPDPQNQQSTRITHRERVLAVLRHLLAQARSYNEHTTSADVAWVEEIIDDTLDALDAYFQPCLLCKTIGKAMQSLRNRRVNGL